jgi:hypothetical protein
MIGSRGRAVAIGGVVAMAVWLLPMTASAQADCECAEAGAAGLVELRIVATTPRDHARIGPDRDTQVVDLRGQETSVVGDVPPLLEGAPLNLVPVLMAVVEDSPDGCRTAVPPAGVDLSLTGHVYEEETGPVVWTGLCQGTVTVEAAAAGEPEVASTDGWGIGLGIATGVLVVLAVVLLACVPIAARRRA